MTAPAAGRWFVSFLLGVLCAAAASSLHAQTWVLDPAVAPRLTIEQFPSVRELAFAPTTGGRLLIYGNFTHLGNLAAPGFARLESNGKIDATFTTDLSDTERVAVATALPSGNYLAVVVPTPTTPRPPGVLGMISDYWPFGLDQPVIVPVQPVVQPGLPPVVVPRPSSLIRLQPHGPRDPAFAPLACDNTPLLSPFPDGRILVWGDFRTVGGASRNGLARLAPDGALDASFAPALAPTPIVITAAVTAADGSSYVTGYFDESASKRTFVLARLLASGGRDPRFAPAPPTEKIFLLAIQSDGSLLAGNTTLSRYLPSGVRDPGYQLRIPSFVGPVRLAQLPDGRLAVEAVVNTPSNTRSTAIFIVRPDGSVDSSLAPLADTARWQGLVAVLPPGNLLLQHSSPFTGVPGGPPILPVPFGGPTIDSWALTTPNFSSRAPLSLVPIRHATASVDRLEIDAQGRAFVVGSFTHVDGQPRPGFARFLASGALDRGFVPATGNLLLVPPDGRPIVVAGNVARLRDDGSVDPAFAAPPTFPFEKTKWLAGAPDGRLLVATFDPDDKSEANLKLIWLDQNGRRLSTLPTSFAGFAWWGGPLTATPAGYISVSTGPSSVTVPPYPTSPISDPSFGGTPTIPFDPNRPDAIYYVPQPLWGVRILADRRLLVTGNFTTVDGLSRSGVVWLKPDGSVDGPQPPTPAPTGPTPGATAVPTRPLFSLPLPDGRVLVMDSDWDGTKFHTAATCLRDDGTTDPSFDVAANTLARSTQPLADSSFFSNGRRYRRDGALDRNFSPQFRQGPTVAIPSAALAGTSLWVGGDFDRVNGQPRTGLARFESREVVGLTYSPETQTVVAGRAAQFDVTLGTTQPATFSWTHNGVTLPGATTAILRLINTQAAQSGTYRAIVTIAGQTFTSDPATLTVAASTSRLVNFSARSVVAPGSPQIVGFVCATTTPRPVLLRAVGNGVPSGYSADLLPVPVLALYERNQIVAQDRGSAILSPMVTLAQSVGAFRIVSNLSQEAFAGISYGAALAPRLGTGVFTALTSAGDTRSGASLFEFYDTATVSQPTLVRNFSVRGQFVRGRNTVTGGFVIAGNGPVRILVRGLGPALLPFGVPDALSDPFLRLDPPRYTGPSFSNDDWAGVSDIAQAAQQSGAFPLLANSRDSALLLTLEPGVYTATLTSLTDTTGIGLLELYVVDF